MGAAADHEGRCHTANKGLKEEPRAEFTSFGTVEETQSQKTAHRRRFFIF
jgi:hypothetical protein